MDIKAFEDLIKTEISAVITKVFDDIPTLPIDVRQGERVGLQLLLLLVQQAGL